MEHFQIPISTPWRRRPGKWIPWIGQAQCYVSTDAKFTPGYQVVRVQPRIVLFWQASNLRVCAFQDVSTYENRHLTLNGCISNLLDVIICRGLSSKGHCTSIGMLNSRKGVDSAVPIAKIHPSDHEMLPWRVSINSGSPFQCINHRLLCPFPGW